MQLRRRRLLRPAHQPVLQHPEPLRLRLPRPRRQKLCTKNGEVKYPQQELPSGLKWGKDKFNPNYVVDNRKNCHESGTAPCKTACPAHIAIQGYIKLAKEGRYLDALKLIKQDNPFPSVCGYVCNRRCEDACTRGAVDKAVAIDEIKKFIAEQDLKSEDRYIPAPLYRRPIDKPYEEKVAIIGAGPAGLSCAYYLARMGYVNVTVFDRNPAPGGMLVMGIPSYRLDRSALKGEIEVLEKMGVKFRMNTEVGKDVTIQELREQGFKGFYVAIGAQKSSKLRIPGEELEGVYGGVDFLRQVNLGNKPSLGKKCAVIGGGNVAMDVCRTAVRCGAETFVIYRRSEAEMPADKEEVAEAKEEGVKFCFLNAPVEIEGAEGKVTGLKVELMELGEPDEKGRRAPVGTGKFETIEAATSTPGPSSRSTPSPPAARAPSPCTASSRTARASRSAATCASSTSLTRTTSSSASTASTVRRVRPSCTIRRRPSPSSMTGSPLPRSRSRRRPAAASAAA